MEKISWNKPDLKTVKECQVQPSQVSEWRKWELTRFQGTEIWECFSSWSISWDCQEIEGNSRRGAGLEGWPGCSCEIRVRRKSRWPKRNLPWQQLCSQPAPMLSHLRPAFRALSFLNIGINSWNFCILAPSINLDVHQRFLSMSSLYGPMRGYLLQDFPPPQEVARCCC